MGHARRRSHPRRRTAKDCPLQAKEARSLETIEFSVVVPVRDEEGNAGPLAREVAAVLDGRSYEMIFVATARSHPAHLA